MTFNHSSKALTRFECQWFWDIEKSFLDTVIHGGVHCCLFCDLFPHHFGDLNDSCESFGAQDFNDLLRVICNVLCIIFYKSSALIKAVSKATRKSCTWVFLSQPGRYKRKHRFGFLFKGPRQERSNDDERSFRNKQTKTCVVSRLSKLEFGKFKFIYFRKPQEPKMRSKHVFNMENWFIMNYAPIGYKLCLTWDLTVLHTISWEELNLLIDTERKT